jgi:hypothetical protein
MHHKVTERTRALVRALRKLAAEVEPRVEGASEAARAEWMAAQAAWPTDFELARGVVEVSDDDLEVMHARVRRFGQILGRKPSQRASAGNPTV